MKKAISIILVVLLLAVALVTVVACDPETPQNPDNNGDNNNNGNLDNNDNNVNDDNINDDNNNLPPVIDYEVTAEEWNTIFSLQNASNFKSVCSFTMPSDAEFADCGDVILEFDGTTYHYQTIYYLDSEIVMNAEALITKKGDTYLRYSDGETTEITKEQYDEIYTEFAPTSMCYDNFNQFTYNSTSKMYELTGDSTLNGASSFKVAFENGKVVKVDFTIDGEPWTCVFTYGNTETIDFPENN